MGFVRAQGFGGQRFWDSGIGGLKVWGLQLPGLIQEPEQFGKLGTFLGFLIL